MRSEKRRKWYHNGSKAVPKGQSERLQKQYRNDTGMVPKTQGQGGENAARVRRADEKAKANDKEPQKHELATRPRRLRAKYTHRTSLRLMLRVFRPCRGQAHLPMRGVRPKHPPDVPKRRTPLLLLPIIRDRKRQPTLATGGDPSQGGQQSTAALFQNHPPDAFETNSPVRGSGS